MDTGTARLFAEYRAWADELTYAAVAALPPGEATKERPTLFKNMLGTLNHNYLIDRETQRNSNTTGIHGFAAQDQAIQESMGPIVDRTREHLGTSDMGIIATRKLLLEEIRGLESGHEPFAAQHGDGYWVRSASLLLKREVEFDEGARHIMEARV